MFNLLQLIVLFVVCKENPVAHRCVARKGSNVLIAFLGNCGYPFLGSHQNLTTASFLQVYCLV